MTDNALAEDVILALNYAPAQYRAAFETLFALDYRLSQIVAAAREPQLAAIKLAWWRDQLESLESAANPADPLLAKCRTLAEAHRVSGAALAEIAEGWAMMLGTDWAEEGELRVIATLCGSSLFAAASDCVGVSSPGDAGLAYTLAHIVRSSANRESRCRAAAMIVELPRQRLAPSLRPLALLAHWARTDARKVLDGKPCMTMRERAFSALGFAIIPKAV